MDQVKEFLRQCIKYRFWISISVAALLAIIAYFVGSGPVQAKAKTETDKIEGAYKDVKKYTSPGIPNHQYKPLVDEKTQLANRDVNKAWKELYSRQAPLLNWPERVQKRFQEWGRKWPENVAESAVELAKVDYVMAYPEYVERVYKSFKPFDYESGQGIVSAPPKESLLRPVEFDVNKLPDLGKIWSAQERLWIQRTALDVVAQVNREAKDWDGAIIKQINVLEVGNSMAQDQRSIAKGDTLEEAEKILAPGQEAAEAEAPGNSPMGGSMGMMRGMMGGKEGGMGGMMGGGAGGASETVMFVKPAEDKGQFKILPILMSVLVDQDRIQDFLVALENSPMSIQVMDIELQRPSARVTKPEKGTMQNFSAYGDMMMGGMMRGMMGGRGGKEGGMSGYGGMMSGYGQMMGQMMGGRMGGMGRMGMNEMGGMMGGAAAGPSRQGTNKRDRDRSKQREEETKAVEKAKGPSLFDPYYDIVEVKIYGQARFYNPPPADAETEPSPGEAAAAEAEKPDATKAAEPAKAEAPKADELPKAEAPKAETKADGAPKPETPKAETKAAEPAKVEAPKPEAPKPAETKSPDSKS